MIKVQEIQDGIFNVVIDGNTLVTMKHILDDRPCTNEMFIAIMLRNVFRLDDKNIILKGLSNGMD